MPKRFVFRSAVATKKASEPRKFAEPSPEQIKKAKEIWKRLAPKGAKGLLK